MKAYNNLAVIAGLLGWVSNPRPLDIWFHSYQLQHQEVSAMHCHIITKNNNLLLISELNYKDQALLKMNYYMEQSEFLGFGIIKSIL